MSAASSIRRFIIEDLSFEGDPADLDDGYPLIESEAIDSMGIMRLVGFIEETLGVEIDDEDLVLENFATIADITRLVEEKKVA